MTSRELAERWIVARGLRADDATVVLIRKRIEACLTSLHAGNLIVRVPEGGVYNRWHIRRIEH